MRHCDCDKLCVRSIGNSKECSCSKVPDKHINFFNFLWFRGWETNKLSGYLRRHYEYIEEGL